jgi:RimJ/RimL family protein N-acetyltransferase
MGLRPEWRDRRWGTRLMRGALDAGDRFGFTRIELTVYSNNPRAAALYRKLGFAEEGVKQMSVRIGDTYFDEILMARLRR